MNCGLPLKIRRSFRDLHSRRCFAKRRMSNERKRNLAVARQCGNTWNPASAHFSTEYFIPYNTEYQIHSSRNSPVFPLSSIDISLNCAHKKIHTVVRPWYRCYSFFTSNRCQRRITIYKKWKQCSRLQLCFCNDREGRRKGNQRIELFVQHKEYRDSRTSWLRAATFRISGSLVIELAIIIKINRCTYKPRKILQILPPKNWPLPIVYHDTHRNEWEKIMAKLNKLATGSWLMLEKTFRCSSRR